MSRGRAEIGGPVAAVALLAALLTGPAALASPLGPAPQELPVEGAPAPRAHEELSAAQIARRAAASIVLVKVRLAGERAVRQGTGFVVAEGAVATSMHLLDGAEAVQIRTADRRRISTVTIRGFDAAGDVVLLGANTRGMPALPLGEAASLRAGDAVVVIGNPIGLRGTVSEGVFSAWREPVASPVDEEDDEFGPDRDVLGLPETRLLQISAQAAPGSSGAPVFDRRGAVVALTTGGLGSGELDLNFAVPIDLVKPLLEFDLALDLESLREQADRERRERAEPSLAEARLALELERWDDAAREVDRALAMHPRMVEALLIKAEVLLRQGEFREAEQVLLQATTVDPDSAEAWTALGDFYLGPALESASVSREFRVIGLSARGPSMRARAADAFEKALEIDEESALSLFGMGALHFADGSYRRARNLLQRAIESDPDLLEAGVQLGESEMMLDDVEAARDAFAAVLEVDDEFAPAHHGMARTYFRQQDLVRALEHWQEFLELSREDPSLEALRERTLRHLRRVMPEALPPEERD